MKRPKVTRIIIGYMMAIAASALVALLAGCLYAIVMEGNHAPALAFLKAVIYGRKDALLVMFLVVKTTAIAALTIASLVSVFIGLPLFFISQKLRRTSLFHYAVSGFLISMVVITIVTVLHIIAGLFLLSSDFHFAIISILFAGPIATLTFWRVVRPDRQ